MSAQRVWIGLALLAVAAWIGRVEGRQLRMEHRTEDLYRKLQVVQSSQSGDPRTTTIRSGSEPLTEGLPTAPVTVVYFTDYRCPFCRVFAARTLPILRHEFIERGFVRLVIRDFPLHEGSVEDAIAVRCAAAQHRYQEFSGLVFASRSVPADTLLTRFARIAKLNIPAWAACRGDRELAHRVDQDAASAAAANIHGTPAFVIGPTTNDSTSGRLLIGALPTETFREAILTIAQSASTRIKAP